jgi:hypothetical protein
MLLLAGCTTVNVYRPPPPVTTPGEAQIPKVKAKGPVSFHVWGAVLSYGIEQQEYPGYAIYTYLLFNSSKPDPASSEGQRYDGILQAILRDVKPEETGTAAGWRKDETNIFCVPLLTKRPAREELLAHYNYEMSFKYLAVLQGAVKENPELFRRLERRPGPFLVSLYEPLPRLQGGAATRMLYLDLTEMPAAGMRQVLDAYRQRLNAEPLRNVEKLKESLKMILLKYALMLDENLKIVDVAFARFR